MSDWEMENEVDIMYKFTYSCNFQFQTMLMDSSNLQVWSEKEAQGQTMINDCDINLKWMWGHPGLE